MRRKIAHALRGLADKIAGPEAINVSVSGNIVTFEHAPKKGQPVHIEYFTNETVIENPTPWPKWAHKDQ